MQKFGNFSSVGQFLTPPPVGSDECVYVLDTADMGHAEADGANEWEDDHNARLYNAPGISLLCDCQLQVFKVCDKTHWLCPCI